MRPGRALAGAATNATIRLVGRRNVVRASRFVLNRARLDIANTIERNGERDLQAAVAIAASASEPFVVLDVGANLGQWATSMLDEAKTAGRENNLDLHVFEPSRYTADRLRGHLPDIVTVNQVALSDRSGTSRLHVVGLGAGTNSLHLAASSDVSELEDVVLSTVDEYCEMHQLGSIALLKVDTEGHDLNVLRGAARLLARTAVKVVQFEYNHRWIYSRSFLRDAFDVLETSGYVVGKLTPRGIEVYRSGWDFEMESFVEGNYVAWPSGSTVPLSQVDWWKS